MAIWPSSPHVHSFCVPFITLLFLYLTDLLSEQVNLLIMDFAQFGKTNVPHAFGGDISLTCDKAKASAAAQRSCDSTEYVGLGST